MKSIFKLTFVIGLLWPVGFNNVFAQNTNRLDLKWWLSQKSIVWTGETNGFRTGAQRFSIPDDEIDIFILSVNTNNNRFVYPPYSKLPKLQLRDTNGTIIPITTKAIEETLPKKISVKDLPSRSAARSRNGPDYNYFFTSPSSPNIFRRISITNAYQVKVEADYILTVFPQAYKFDTNFQFLDRIDFPPVTTTIHLSPSN